MQEREREREKAIDYVIRKQHVSNIDILYRFPLFIRIELSRACNAHCIMCPRGGEDLQKGLMKKKLREKILEDIKPYAPFVRRVIPQGLGEPLLDPGLFDFIRQCKNIGVPELALTTNASLLDGNRRTALLESGIDQIDISVDGYSKEVFEGIRIGLDRDIVYDNIENLITLRNSMQKNTKIRLRFVKQEKNTSEVDQFKAYWMAKLSPIDAISIKEIHNFGGYISSSMSSSSADMKKPCSEYFSNLEIQYDGTASCCGICSYDTQHFFDLGNITTSTICEIWNSEKNNKIRNILLDNGKLGIAKCQNCTVWDHEKKLSEECGKSDFD